MQRVGASSWVYSALTAMVFAGACGDSGEPDGGNPSIGDGATDGSRGGAASAGRSSAGATSKAGNGGGGASAAGATAQGGAAAERGAGGAPTEGGAGGASAEGGGSPVPGGHGGDAEGGSPAGGSGDSGGAGGSDIPDTVDGHVHIFISNTCDVAVDPTEITVAAGQSVYLSYHNHSGDYEADVWMSYGGGYLGLAQGGTWDDPIARCADVGAYTAYADVSIHGLGVNDPYCPGQRMLIHCQ